MQALSTYRRFNVSLSAFTQHFFCKVRIITVVINTMVKVNTSKPVFTVKRIGKRYTAVFTCELTSCFIVRPSSRVVATCELVGMTVNQVFLNLSFFFVVLGSQNYPIWLVFHFLRNTLVKNFLPFGKLFTWRITRLLIGFHFLTFDLFNELVYAKFVFCALSIIFKPNCKVRR